MVALGGILGFVFTQAAYAIAPSRVMSLIVGTFDVCIFSAWIVLSGCLLLIFEKKGTSRPE